MGAAIVGAREDDDRGRAAESAKKMDKRRGDGRILLLSLLPRLYRRPCNLGCASPFPAYFFLSYSDIIMGDPTKMGCKRGTLSLVITITTTHPSSFPPSDCVTHLFFSFYICP